MDPFSADEADPPILAARSVIALSLCQPWTGAACSTSALASTISAVFTLQAAGRLDLIDFSEPTVLNANPHHLIAALRASSSCRDCVPTWEIGLWLAIDACASHGIDARSVLNGLL